MAVGESPHSFRSRSLHIRDIPLPSFTCCGAPFLQCSSLLRSCRSLQAILSLHGGVEVILYRIVGSALQKSSNLRPSISNLFMNSKDNSILFFCPCAFPNIWIQVIVPPLSTLFSDTAWKMLRDYRPPFGAIFLHQLNNFGILLFCPGSFHKFWIQYFLPTMKTLNICFLILECRLCNFLPVFPVMLEHRLPQLFILCCCPPHAFLPATTLSCFAF
mmetsp:Transcript_5337/g.10185  ORF Transcript_5337/g.10185 Transcript_5337/m.10185 type:complete len:216 (-) Transcript_5337:160-807(-)